MYRYDKAMMGTASIWAEQSYCERHKVGAVISRSGRVVSIGYNGTVSGSDNCCEIEVDGALVSKPSVVHAEANALMFAAKNGIATNECSLFVTLTPCIECAKMIIQAGIKEVVYKDDYRLSDGRDFLAENGILVRQLKE